MFKKTFIMTIAVLVISLILVGCKSDGNIDMGKAEDKIKNLNEQYEEVKFKNEELEKQIESLENNLQNLNSPINLVDLSLNIMDSIKNNDMNELSTYVHQNKGLRFTPYTNIDIQNDKVFTIQEVSALNGDNTVYSWGNYDGSGDSIDLKFLDYYNEFVYDQDFLNAHLIGNNMAIGRGNMIDNMSTAYPNGSFVEYHFTGIDPEYAGIDWASLTLVFEQDGGSWYLVGIIHGQWTI